jgi:hypothetical protein
VPVLAYAVAHIEPISASTRLQLGLYIQHFSYPSRWWGFVASIVHAHAICGIAEPRLLVDVVVYIALCMHLA